MARTQGTTARTQRLIALLATSLLAVTTAFAIGRVFVGHAATYRLLVAGVASALIACALERRNLLLATLISAAAMIVAVGVLVFPSTTWHGLPTLETLRSIGDAAGLVGRQARYQVAPTEALAPLMLGAVTATWAAVFSAHALAFRAGSPLLALLPPVALVAFADTVLEDVVRPLYGVAFLIAAAAVIFADGLRRVQGWGPIWSGPGRQARLTVSAGRGARRVTAAVVAIAAVSPLLVPGFGSKALLDLSTHNEDEVRVNPLVSVASSLQRDDVQGVFDVQSTQPMYWRMVALPDFDGTTWHPDPDPATIDLEPGAALATNAAADPSFAATQKQVQVSFHTTSDLALPWLPLPYPAVSATVDADGLRWDPESGSVLMESPLDSGVSYTATAQAVLPTPQQLRAEQITPSDTVERYTALPGDLPPQIGQLARAWTADASTTYDQVLAIQNRFTSPTGGFTYDQDIAPAKDQNAIVNFLLDTQRGFCQQFASSMAIMLRTLGIPARVAVGFTPGAFNDAGDIRQVTTDDAHAWVEVLFPHYGWLTFDPTPGRGAAAVTAYPYVDPTVAKATDCVSTPAGGCSTVGTGRPGAAGAGGPRSSVKTGATVDILHPGNVVTPALDIGLGVEPPGRRITVRQAVLGLVVLAILVLLAIPPFRALRRRRRLRRAAGEPRTLILATYDVFTERAAELGFPRDVGQTLEEYRAVVASSEALSNGDLDRLTRITSDAAYSSREPDDGRAREATDAAHTVLQELRRHTPWTQRIWGVYLRR
jgi:transglutaminase-like putative cysteine protease